MTAFEFYRKKIGMTQQTLAGILGVSQGAVSNWENGDRKPDIIMLKRIAEALHCTADDLLRDPETNPTP